MDNHKKKMEKYSYKEIRTERGKKKHASDVV